MTKDMGKEVATVLLGDMGNFTELMVLDRLGDGVISGGSWSTMAARKLRPRGDRRMSPLSK